MPIGARNWCLSDFDQTSSKTRIGDLELADVDDRERDRADQHERRLRVGELEEPRHQADREHAHDRPEEQLEEEEHVARAPIRAFRSVTAQTASSSFRQLNEDLLELRLADLHVLDDDALGVKRAARSPAAVSRPRPRCTRPSRRPRHTGEHPAASASHGTRGGSSLSAMTSPRRIWRFSSPEVPRARMRPALMKAISSQSSSASRM